MAEAPTEAGHPVERLMTHLYCYRLMIEEARKLDRALVHLDPAVTGPGTHALIIGVGYYHHLPEGGGKPLTVETSMEQLGCPPHSARAVADWFINSFHNPKKPLASVALVISEPHPSIYRHPVTGAGYEVPTGTAEEVKQAVRSWIRRANSSTESLTVFYFCGHGLAEGLAETLLLRDYGADSLGPFDGAMDLSGFKAAMETMKPSWQVFFIDACRVGSLNLGASKGTVGVQMLQPDPLMRGLPAPPAQSVHYATFDGMSAYGADEKPSIYAESLLLGLSRAGRQDDTGDWWVGTFELQTLVEMHTERLARMGNVVQRPEVQRASNFAITRLVGAPDVPVYVFCDPLAAIQLASLTCHSDGQLVCQHHGPSAPDVFEWETFLKIGCYEFVADFGGNGGYKNMSQGRFIMPPCAPVRLQIETDAGPAL